MWVLVASSAAMLSLLPAQWLPCYNLPLSMYVHVYVGVGRCGGPYGQLGVWDEGGGA